MHSTPDFKKNIYIHFTNKNENKYIYPKNLVIIKSNVATQYNKK